jgi:hypothetical protein
MKNMESRFGKLNPKTFFGFALAQVEKDLGNVVE